MSTDRPTEKIDAPDDATVREPNALSGRSGRPRLRVLDGPTVTSFTLPGKPVVVIGRSAQADITIDAPSVSRQHARLYVGKTLQLEDVESSNGTFVRGVQLAKGQRVDIQPGDEIVLGTVLCIVQGGAQFVPPHRLRALRTHEYFEARLEDECAQAAESAGLAGLGLPGASGAFGLLRIRVDGAAGDTFEAALLAHVHAAEVVARYGPREYELLLTGASNPQGRAVEIVAALKRAGWQVLSGTASYPRDGRTPDALIERSAVRPRATGGDETARPAGDVVLEDEAMRRLHRLLAKVAASDISVLLLGETGTGKEVFAERLHALSPRAGRAFRSINCGALVDNLVESELFGYEKGAFTGATATREGIFESAEGGTVFLDEVGELPLALQPKLLRVLESRKVRRIGGHEERPVNVRFVAATNRDLDRDVAEGRFRSDLLFRLNGFSFEIPPLRERLPEIEPLARRFLALKAGEWRHERVPELSAEALEFLMDYPWPGNIRELRNMMERALVLADGDVITPEHLPTGKMRASSAGQPPKLKPAPPVAAPAAEPSGFKPRPLAEVVDEAEGEHVRRTLEHCLHNQTRAAELLGVARGTIVKLIEKHKIPRPRGGGGGG
jgi:DNA-binding NtrC family response regulator